MLDQSYYRKTDEIIEHYGRRPASLIPIMQDIQAEYRYLPGELLTYVASQIGVTEAKAFSVATFYENFSFEPKGKYIIKVCDGTACHVRKSMPVKEALMKELGLSHKKHTTDDMMFTVETVSCLGACGLAPTLTVNDEVHPKMTPEKAVDLLEELRKKLWRENNVKRGFVRPAERGSECPYYLYLPYSCLLRHRMYGIGSSDNLR